MKEYTKILADYAAGLKYEELPADVVEQAKKIILHTIAVSIASSNMSPTVNAAAVAAGPRRGPGATLRGAQGGRGSAPPPVCA
ncbi:MmgE/PrpD family protein, partial [uncultured Anaerotruncus sp.]|uniref:MmgE/PrpD family protein n=1 Tax=uncultured Anaerotruncus sp. TaxID=905011 RepID=UPI00258B0C21